MLDEMIDFGQSYDDALTYDCNVWHVDDAIEGLYVETRQMMYIDYVILFQLINELIQCQNYYQTLDI